MGLDVLTVNPALLALLRARRIYTSRAGGDRWRVGTQIAVNVDCAIEPYAQLFAGVHIPRALGAFSYSRSDLDPAATIGRYCSFGHSIGWMGHDHPMQWASTSPTFYDHNMPSVAAFQKEHDPQPPERKDFWPRDPHFTIGNDVWIGDGAMIGSGVTVGDGAVIGARALVLKDVPPYAIVVGSPARVLRLRVPEALLERFLATRWWRFAPNVVQRLPVEDPERFLDALDARLADDPPPEIDPRPLRYADLKAASQANA